MFTTKVLRQAAQQAERTPLIKFIGKRSIPSSIDHTAHPHPASPTHALPESFSSSQQASHTSFSSYRDHAQQFGPLRKTIAKQSGDPGVGARTGHDLGTVQPPKGVFFDRSELPVRFRRMPFTTAEIEAIETGGATLSA